MIKRLEVKGLYGHFDFDLDFQPDLNLITGRNGSGKTAILKLLWYLISGNFDRLVAEIQFERARVETDSFFLELVLTNDGNVRLSSDLGGQTQDKFRVDHPIKFEQLKTRVLEKSKSSLFFPTFRRIEGGFTLLRRGRPSRPVRLRTAQGVTLTTPDSGLEAAIGRLASLLSVEEHTFVVAISTTDISQLVTARYAAISQQTNQFYNKLATSIIARISERQGDSQDARILRDIEDEISTARTEQERLLQPFNVLSSLVTQVFQYKGIKVAESVPLGEAAEAISSDVLSAGEKQMLSFLCYNAFTTNCIIFIDEPEISLHVDWQRRLFPTLLNQNTGNQFVIATHSPFIYSKYADKELPLSTDRGE